MKFPKVPKDDFGEEIIMLNDEQKIAVLNFCLQIDRKFAEAIVEDPDFVEATKELGIDYRKAVMHYADSAVDELIELTLE